jgi:tetratricopeptide (TPR) repeat protein
MDSSQELKSIAKGEKNEGPIVRATAMRLLGQMVGWSPKDDLKPFFQDPNPMIRRSSIELGLDRYKLIELLKDPIMSVRLNAMRRFLYHLSSSEQPSSEDVKLIKGSLYDLADYLKANADQSGAHHLQAQAHMVMGDAPRAILSYEIALALQPELVGVRLPLAELLERKGDKERAKKLREEELKLMRRDLKLAPERVDLWYRLGLMEYGQGHVYETLEAMGKVLKLDPSHYNAGAFVIQLSQRKGRWRVVRDTAEMLLKHHPNDPWLLQVIRQAIGK